MNYSFAIVHLLNSFFTVFDFQPVVASLFLSSSLHICLQFSYLIIFVLCLFVIFFGFYLSDATCRHSCQPKPWLMRCLLRNSAVSPHLQPGNALMTLSRSEKKTSRRDDMKALIWVTTHLRHFVEGVELWLVVFVWSILTCTLNLEELRLQPWINSKGMNLSAGRDRNSAKDGEHNGHVYVCVRLSVYYMLYFGKMRRTIKLTYCDITKILPFLVSNNISNVFCLQLFKSFGKTTVYINHFYFFMNLTHGFAFQSKLLQWYIPWLQWFTEMHHHNIFKMVQSGRARLSASIWG